MFEAPQECDLNERAETAVGKKCGSFPDRQFAFRLGPPPLCSSEKTLPSVPFPKSPSFAASATLSKCRPQPEAFSVPKPPTQNKPMPIQVKMNYERTILEFPLSHWRTASDVRQFLLSHHLQASTILLAGRSWNALLEHTHQEHGLFTHGARIEAVERCISAFTEELPL